MKRFTLRTLLVLIFLGLAGSGATSCIVKTKRHPHAVKKRGHGKHKKHRKHHKHRKHKKHRKGRDYRRR